MTNSTDVRELERQAAELAPQIREVLAGVADVAAGRVPAYRVRRVLEDRGTIVRNPARDAHRLDDGDTDDPQAVTSRCRCGAAFGPFGPAVVDGVECDGIDVALGALEAHAARELADVPRYVFTPAGERFARQARRFGMPGGVR
jgi:hypothetical protein